MSLSFAQKLDNYARLAVQVGVGLQPGQRLLLLAPLECAAFARRVVEAAYTAGALLVDLLYVDDEVQLARYRLAPEASFAEVSTWSADALIKGSARGDAVLRISGSDPDLLKGQDPQRVAQVQRGLQAYSEPFARRISAKEINWCICAAPVAAWARRLYPELAAPAAIDALWEEIFRICRADQANPVAAWQAHAEALRARRAQLDARQYRALRYRGPGTALELGLPANHRWLGGLSHTPQGLPFIANLPTEEVFTLPHREQAEGWVAASMPLAYAGTLIEGIRLRFAGGQVVEARAEREETVLHKLLETDAGARRLGEVALVPQSSPVARSGKLFLNTLYDENAASHLAVGRAYRVCLEGGAAMDDAAFAAAGGNDSLTHVDFMIGSSELEVDGLRADGGVEPLMRGGEWTQSANPRS
ncbi:aminopeptidase [bacterium]|nr:aminopeptidase [bacterium]